MTTLTDLNNFDLLRVSGNDAPRFLQGQLSCNIDRLQPGQSVAGTYCNIKGRVIADLRVFMMEDTLYLLCARGLGGPLKQTLDKYIVFFKADITVVTEQFECYGVHGDGAAATVKELVDGITRHSGEVLAIEGGVVITLPDSTPRYLLLLQNQHPLVDRLNQGGVTDDLEEWELADIRQGIVHITPATQETYTPQLLNYDLNGLIDFRKGCYTGQEIVARMHYRGAAKKRLYRAGVKHANPSAESRVLHGEEVVGEVVSAALVAGDHYELLAILPRDLVEQKAELMLLNEDDSERSPLELLSLPADGTA